MKLLWVVMIRFVRGEWEPAFLKRSDEAFNLNGPNPLAVFGSMDEADRWAHERYKGTQFEFRVQPAEVQR